MTAMADANVWLSRRRRVHDIIEVGASEDRSSRLYDLVNSLAIVVKELTRS